MSCIIAGAALAAEPPGFAGEPFAASRSFWRVGGQIRPAWFVCASVDGADYTVVSLPDARGRVTVAQPLSKGRPDLYRLGPADPGAGQVYWPLMAADGREIGQVHAFNPGMIDDPKAATTATFTSIRVNGAQFNCRWLERTRLLGFSRRRAIVVTQAPDGRLEYRTFDAKDQSLTRIQSGGPEQTTTASLDLEGGRSTASGFVFENGPYAYRIAAGPSDARITVLKAGRVIASEPLVAWTLGAP